eukprot:TRINITY_DN1900_c0_g1_i18.p1 TRINITY_DN1900_c0_g1~~TRINITY_DN1900_c0_g1_i18.p1  ORF type:complete len:530 (-),score=112.24 TRINITY_DN1900_c0_g1_i18:361-1950(-)
MRVCKYVLKVVECKKNEEEQSDSSSPEVVKSSSFIPYQIQQKEEDEGSSQETGLDVRWKKAQFIQQTTQDSDDDDDQSGWGSEDGDVQKEKVTYETPLNKENAENNQVWGDCDVNRNQAYPERYEYVQDNSRLSFDDDAYRQQLNLEKQQYDLDQSRLKLQDDDMQKSQTQGSSRKSQEQLLDSDIDKAVGFQVGPTKNELKDVWNYDLDKSQPVVYILVGDFTPPEAKKEQEIVFFEMQDDDREQATIVKNQRLSKVRGAVKQQLDLKKTISQVSDKMRSESEETKSTNNEGQVYQQYGKSDEQVEGLTEPIDRDNGRMPKEDLGIDNTKLSIPKPDNIRQQDNGKQNVVNDKVTLFVPDIAKTQEVYISKKDENEEEGNSFQTPRQESSSDQCSNLAEYVQDSSKIVEAKSIQDKDTVDGEVVEQQPTDSQGPQMNLSQVKAVEIQVQEQKDDLQEQLKKRGLVASQNEGNLPANGTDFAQEQQVQSIAIIRELNNQVKQFEKQLGEMKEKITLLATVLGVKMELSQ